MTKHVRGGWTFIGAITLIIVLCTLIAPSFSRAEDGHLNHCAVMENYLRMEAYEARECMPEIMRLLATLTDGPMPKHLIDCPVTADEFPGMAAKACKGIQ